MLVSVSIHVDVAIEQMSIDHALISYIIRSCRHYVPKLVGAFKLRKITT